MQASPDRDTETASLSLPPTHDMNSTQGHCSTHTTAATEPLSPATGRPTLLEINLPSLIISWGSFTRAGRRRSQVTGKRTKSEDRVTNMSEEWCWEWNRERMSNEDGKRIEKKGLVVSVCDWDQALCYVLLSMHRTCLGKLLMTGPIRNLLLWIFLSMPQHILSTNLICRT